MNILKYIILLLYIITVAILAQDFSYISRFMKDKSTKEMKIEWFNKIKKNKYMFKNVPVILMKDKVFMHECVKIFSPNLLIYTSKYASKKFKSNMPFLIDCIETHSEILKYLPYYLQKNKEFIFKCFQRIYYSLEYASDKLKNDKEFILKCIKYCPIALTYASNKLINKDFILYIIKKNIYDPTFMYCILELLPEIYKNDYNIVYIAIEKNINNIDKHYYNGIILKYVSYTLQNDFDIVYNSVSISANELSYAPYEFMDNEIIITAAINNAELRIKEKYNSKFAQYISIRLQNNFNIMLKVVSICLNNFEYISNELKINIDFITALIDNDSINFFISNELYYNMTNYILINKQIILTIIGKKNINLVPIPWRYIPEIFSNDRDIILHYGRKYKHLYLDNDFLKTYKYYIDSIDPLNNYIQINDLPIVIYTINNDGSITNIAGEVVYKINDSDMTFSQLSNILYSIRKNYIGFINIDGKKITPFNGYKKITEVYTNVKIIIN